MAAGVDDRRRGRAVSDQATIEVHVADLRQFFNTVDPSPFREGDLDPGAEEFIVEWAREVPSDRPLALVVHVDRPAGAEEESVLRDAVRGFFSHGAEMSRRRLRQLFARGRTSLAIGITCLAISLALGEVLARALGRRPIAEMARESLLMWRCGGRWTCSCTTGGPFAPRRGWPTGWPPCRFASSANGRWRQLVEHPLPGL